MDSNIPQVSNVQSKETKFPSNDNHDSILNNFMKAIFGHTYFGTPDIEKEGDNNKHKTQEFSSESIQGKSIDTIISEKSPLEGGTHEPQHASINHDIPDTLPLIKPAFNLDSIFDSVSYYE